MQGGRAGSFRGLQAQTTARLGTTLKADQPLQPSACREAGGAGLPKLGVLRGRQALGPNRGPRGLAKKKYKGHTKGAFLNEKNKSFPTVDFKRRIFKKTKIM